MKLSREYSFYFLVTGLSVQSILIVLFAFPLFSLTASTPGNDDLFVFNLFLFVIFSPFSAWLIAIGNKGFRLMPTGVLLLGLFLLSIAPLCILKLYF